MTQASKQPETIDGLVKKYRIEPNFQAPSVVESPSLPKVMELATCQPKIKTFGRNFKAKEWTELSTLMYACAKAVGVQDPPSAVSLMEFSTFVYRQFPDLNMAEINEAFDMVCARKLTLNDEPIEHYGSFSQMFIGNVLTAYKQYRDQEIARFISSQPKPKEIPAPEKSKEEKRAEEIQKAMKRLEELLLPQFELYKKTKRYLWTELDEKVIFASLEKLKIIDMNTQEKKDFASDMTKKLRLDIAYLVKKKLAIKDPKSKEFIIEPHYLKRICQSEQVKRWIMVQEMNDTDIVWLINDKLNQKND